MKKFTHYCFIDLRKISLCILCILLLGNFSHAQDDFQKRLEFVEEKLEVLSDSLSPGLNESVNFTVVDTPIQEFLRGMAEVHKLNLSIDPNINVRVTNNFTNALVKDVLLFLCREYGLDIRFVSNIMSFFAYAAPPPPPVTYKEKNLDITYDAGQDLLSLNLVQDSIDVFVRQLTRVSGKNVILSPDIESVRLNGFISNMPFDQALEKIAFSNGLEVKKTLDNFYIMGKKNLEVDIEQKPVRPSARNPNKNTPAAKNIAEGENLFIELNILNGDTLVTVEAVNSPIAEVIKFVSYELNKNFVFFSEPPGNTTSNVKRIRYDDFLSYLLQGSTHTYRCEDDVYLIGDRGLEGLRNTEFVKLHFRTVEEIDQVIPVEMAKGVEIKVFKELNSLILSGGRPQINEILAFIKGIDKPVPNILIEVIVADIRKGTSLKTGISAFLADSVPNTSGQVFPGVDVTLSSKSINSVLEKLDETGLVNLGKVTPKFYATLEAMEQNNNLDVRSTPKLSTLNGHEASLTIGQSVYYLEETQNISGGVSPITTVSRNFKKVEANLSIKINPIVSGNDHITLNIAAEFSDFIPPQIQGAPPGNATRSFVSQIRIRNEEMIILGGLEEIRNSKTNSGFPLLSRIPILNFLFAAKSNARNDNQLIVFIKPTIVY